MEEAQTATRAWRRVRYLFCSHPECLRDFSARGSRPGLFVMVSAAIVIGEQELAMPKEIRNMQFEDPSGTLESLSARIIAIRDSL